MSDVDIRIVCPMIPPSHNVLRRKYKNHHAYRQLRNTWQRTIFALAGARNGSLLRGLAASHTKMRVEVELRHAKQYDEDNLHASVKPILDSLVNLEFICGDDPQSLEQSVTQVKSRECETEIRLRVAE